VHVAGIRQLIDIGTGLPTMAPQVRAAAQVYDAATTRMFVRSREQSYRARA
jgi:S-adenosyl methyltransferase